MISEVSVTNKTIEKIEAYKAKEITKAMKKAQQGYEEAKDFFTDTGYDRYFRKMEKYEKEIQEIEDYLHKDEVKTNDLSTDQCREYLDMKKDIQSISSKFFFMFADFNLPETSEVQGIQRILEKYK